MALTEFVDTTQASVEARTQRVSPTLGLPIAPVQTAYTLLSNATATGASVPGVVGGSYIWSITSTGWNVATATLQALGPDGVTWVDILAKTANFTGGVVVGNNATLRVAITAAVPSAGVYSNIS